MAKKEKIQNQKEIEVVPMTLETLSTMAKADYLAERGRDAETAKAYRDRILYAFQLVNASISKLAEVEIAEAGAAVAAGYAKSYGDNRGAIMRSYIAAAQNGILGDCWSNESGFVGELAEASIGQLQAIRSRLQNAESFRSALVEWSENGKISKATKKKAADDKSDGNTSANAEKIANSCRKLDSYSEAEVIGILDAMSEASPKIVRNAVKKWLSNKTDSAESVKTDTADVK